MPETRNWAAMLEEQAANRGDHPFLYLIDQDQYISYNEMDKNANRIGNYLLANGGGPGKGIATLMENSSQFLDIFFGIQKIGMYINPVNTELRGEGLIYIIDNSDAEFLVIDSHLFDLYTAIKDHLPKIKKVFVNALEVSGRVEMHDRLDLGNAYADDVDSGNPNIEFSNDLKLMILYTSGTTGLPKGVVSRYNRNMLQRISSLTEILLTPDSVYYTPLPLIHGNALYVTTTLSLCAGSTVALAKKFSASRFWDDIKQSGATIFNTIGAIIPILMKQPPRANESDHPLIRVISAGCPAELWEPFEKRFNVEIFEAYGSVEGSGLIINFGNAPKGSLGKPHESTIRIVNKNRKDVEPGEIGELLFKVIPDKKNTIEYYNNTAAAQEKVIGEWAYSGDLMFQDSEGNIYFVGRNTDSMRRRGENVSAFDVEKEILKHENVMECAVYGVPSEMTEDDIMATIRPVNSGNFDVKEIWDFLKGKLAKFAIPRYLRVVDDFPRTPSYRIKKTDLKKAGVTKDTFDSEKDYSKTDAP